MTESATDWVFGIHGVRALLSAEDDSVRRLVIAFGRRNPDIEALATMAKARGIRVERMPRPALARITDGGNHQGVAAERRAFVPATERDLATRLPGFDDPLLVILDGIEDPRNLGACLRTAEAAGADAVLVPKRGSAPLSSTVAKTASGALEHLFVVEVGNLARCLKWLRDEGVWLAGGVEGSDGVPYTEVDYRGALGVVVGSEHRGLRRLTRESCDYLVTIPMAGATTSLNVSVALGVLLFEVRRQRDRAG
ncbi:MAG: 23S rRNA (guanosine(2251)-2'-O)-methyltransferase RlmB [Gammaproteobacteria bacterium]|nr:23S rRNA (guanosine(2251)-2'-O)-methyltransferase RlmB [Gammaproteobacteria bacterium]